MAWGIILFVLNALISWSNAYVAGKNMRLARESWFAWILNWATIIMAGCGFTWCYTIALIGGAYAIGKLDHTQVDLGMKLGYVLIVPSLIGSGFVITIHSWIAFIKRPSLGGGLTTAWNTYAQYSNTVNAVRFFPEAAGDVLSSLTGGKDSRNSDSKDGQAKMAMLTLFLVVFALLLGVFTTRYIVLTAAASEPVKT